MFLKKLKTLEKSFKNVKTWQKFKKKTFKNVVHI